MELLLLERLLGCEIAGLVAVALMVGGEGHWYPFWSSADPYFWLWSRQKIKVKTSLVLEETVRYL